MARQAVADGISWMCATPHVRGWQQDCLDLLPARVAALQRELNLNGVQLQLALGSEMRICSELRQPAGNERLYTLNGSRYLLVELPANDYPLYTDEALFDLQLRGLTPILAHPERNGAIQGNIGLMNRLVQRGVLGQLTGDSLLPDAPRMVRKTAEAMLARGLVHLIASDGHNAVSRPPRMAAAVEAAAPMVGEARAQAMVTTAPWAILHDEPLDGSLPPVERKRVGWWLWAW
jgi:protein-tyrosine phosphatase